MEVLNDNQFAEISEESPEMRREYNAWLKAAEMLHNTWWHIKMRCNSNSVITESLASEINISFNQLIEAQSLFNSEGGLKLMIDQ